MWDLYRIRHYFNIRLIDFSSSYYDNYFDINSVVDFDIFKSL